MTQPRPNILLVAADQLRADCLSAAGRRTVRTPVLDRPAAEGAMFMNHFGQCPPCGPQPYVAVDRHVPDESPGGAERNAARRRRHQSNLAGTHGNASAMLNMAQRMLSWRASFNRRELTGIQMGYSGRVDAARERRIV